MQCRSQTFWELLHPFAHHCQHAPNNSQHCWRNNVGSCVRSLRIDYKLRDTGVVFFPRCSAGPKLFGSCYTRLHTTANTRQTTPNIVGATMLGVVAPVCTQPNSFDQNDYNTWSFNIQKKAFLSRFIFRISQKLFCTQLCLILSYGYTWVD